MSILPASSFVMAHTLYESQRSNMDWIFEMSLDSSKEERIEILMFFILITSSEYNW